MINNYIIYLYKRKIINSIKFINYNVSKNLSDDYIFIKLLLPLKCDTKEIMTQLSFHK